MRIENLVFEGGGVKGIAYAGALDVLEQRGLMAAVHGVAGTSAGAYTAMLVAIGCPAAQIRALATSTDYPGLEDRLDPLRLATQYGLYAGHALLAWIEQGVSARGLPVDVTFRALAAAGGRDLRVFATDLTARDVREFSLRATPDVAVACAVRASMSIPLMFAAWRFPDGAPDDHVYIDGGVVMNYPIAAFDGDAAPAATLGFRLRPPADRPATSLAGYDHPVGYAEALYGCIIGAQAIDVLHSPADRARSVLIDDCGYSAVDFHLTAKDYDRLVACGRAATEAYLDATTARTATGVSA
ncbi:MAG TPA: patatin-like phospholipase family protein [Vicinamibacterales bacterium]